MQIGAKMNIKDKMKKWIILSIALIMLGSAIGAVGYGMAGFQMTNVMKPGDNHWYQTIKMDENGNCTIGVNIRLQD